MNVMFLCLGNICRSPIAEGILRKKFLENNVSGSIESAGFESFNINDAPEERAVKIAALHGIDITSKKAKLFTEDDFDRFDKIFVMDLKSMQDAKDFARNENDLGKLDYLMNLLEPGKNLSIADPYNSGFDECEKVFEIMDKACEKITEIALKDHRHQ
jgi:protein-tyrosine phosphatase